MKIKTFKFQFFAGVTIFSLFSGISVYAQSPNETDSLQTEEISQDNRIKINGYLRAGIFGGEKEIRNETSAKPTTLSIFPRILLEE